MKNEMNKKESVENSKDDHKPRRRSTREVDIEVLNLIIEAGKPIRWKDLAEKAKEKDMAGKVLSDALKRLMANYLVVALSRFDENGRPAIHYYVIVEDLSENSKLWFANVEKTRKSLFRSRSKEERIKIMVKFFRDVIDANEAIYASAVREALKSKNDHEAIQRFRTLHTALITNPSLALLYTFLEDRDISDEVLKVIEQSRRKKSVKKLTQGGEKS
jgi:predicted transcriptional regulator